MGGAGPIAGAQPRVVPGREPPEKELSLPYRGERLRGDALLGRLDAWVAAGVIEPSCAEAVRTVAARPEWLRALTVRDFQIRYSVQSVGFRQECGGHALARGLDVELIIPIHYPADGRKVMRAELMRAAGQPAAIGSR